VGAGGGVSTRRDGEPLEEKMTGLVATLREQQAEAATLDAASLKWPSCSRIQLSGISG